MVNKDEYMKNHLIVIKVGTQQLI